MCRLVKRIFQSRLLFVLSLAAIFYGLFLVPNDHQAGRAWTEIWNLGHIGAFFIIWTFVFNLFPRFSRLSLFQLFVLVIVSTLVLAELIEIVQGWIGRDNEWQDVWDSSVGALLAFALCAPQLQTLSRWPRMAWRVIALSALVAVPWIVWSNLADVVIMNRQFPVLDNFKTPFELTRWRGDRAGIAVQAPAGQHPYLAVQFRPGQYSTVKLKYFHRDWQGYQQLILDVVNPETRAYRVILRIHDRWHRQHHFALSDRFNRAIILKPGYQRIVVALSDVAHAPKTRRMDMQHLEALELFTMDSNVYHQLDIQRIFLE
ncbi:MAG: hypothetical protein P8Z75_04865 [Gammaproteobacteria bacterium]